MMEWLFIVRIVTGVVLVADHISDPFILDELISISTWSLPVSYLLRKSQIEAHRQTSKRFVLKKKPSHASIMQIPSDSPTNYANLIRPSFTYAQSHHNHSVNQRNPIRYSL